MGHPKNTDFINDYEESQSPEEETGKPAASEDFAKLLGESLKQSGRRLSVGDKVRGKILVLGQEDVFVSIGAQSEGVIQRRDLLDEAGHCPYKKDDVIELYVTQIRGTDIRLSKEPTGKNIAEDLEDAFDMMLPVQGRIVEVCKGGVRVNLHGKIAFCPISQIDVKHVENAEEYVGRSFEFRITKFEEGGRNLVVSRRSLLEEERELNAGSFLEEHKDGEIVPGKVARLEKFGAFVELAPGLDGLVHISEIAWSRIGDPSEILTVGEPISVKILKRETLNGRVKISLSIKQAAPASDREASSRGAPENSSDMTLQKDPWSRYSVGQLVTGKVNRKEPYGLFIQLEPGITGLLHQSKTFERPDFRMEKFKVGDSIAVQVGEVKQIERRISLDLPRDPGEEDWKQHQPPPQASMGTLADKFKAALAAKKK